MRERERES